MALTVDNFVRGSAGHKRAIWMDVDFDNSYASGGESLNPASYGFRKWDWVLASGNSGYTFEYDYTNKKLKVYAVGQSGAVTVDPANHTAVASVDTDVTVTGLATTDTVIVRPPLTLEAGIVVQTATVPSADTLRIRTTNPTAGAINPASASWTWVVTNRKEIIAATDLSGLTNIRVYAVGH